jgi:hypothetical protein
MANTNDDICIRITVQNPQGQSLGGTVDLEFQPHDSGETVNVKGQDASKEIDVSGLQRTPVGLYQLTVTPTDVFTPVSQFVTIPASGSIAVTVVIDKGTSDGVCIVVTVHNPQGQPLGGTVDLVFAPQTPGSPVTLKAQDASKDIAVSGLQRGPQGNYQLTVTPTDVAKPATQSVTIPASGFATATVVIDKGGNQSEPPPLQIPESFTEATLAPELAHRLVGRVASPTPAFTPSRFPPKAIWVDTGSEVLLHLDSVQAKLADGLLLVSVDFECDQTGRTPLVASFALTTGADAAGLFATTDELPRGNGLLASRWGKIFQDTVWAALTSLISDHAAERKLFPLGLIASGSQLNLHSGPPLTASQFISPGGTGPAPHPEVPR